MMDLLWKKGFYLPSICLICYQDAETVSHLLIHCPFSWEIWCGVSRDFGLTFIASLGFMAFLYCWRTVALSAFGKRLWRWSLRRFVRRCGGSGIVECLMVTLNQLGKCIKGLRSLSPSRLGVAKAMRGFRIGIFLDTGRV